MKKQNWSRMVGEFCLAGIGFLLIPWWPRAAIVKLAGGLAGVGRLFFGRSRRIARANLDLAYGNELTDGEKETILNTSSRHFCLVLLDLFWFSFNGRRRMSRWFTFDESFEAFWRTDRAIAVSGHFGNWELLGQAVSLRGGATVSVAAPLANPLVDRMVLRFRQRMGQRVARREGAVRELLKAVAGGMRPALLVDQNTLPVQGGEYVPFFGRPVPMTKAAALLSQRTGAPIVFAYCVIAGNGGYRGLAFRPLDVPRGRHARSAATRAVALQIEAAVRRDPTQWMWAYKRWKYIPDGEDPARYPFYARRVSGSESGGSRPEAGRSQARVAQTAKGTDV